MDVFDRRYLYIYGRPGYLILDHVEGGNELTIEQIVMNSPAEFNFKGIGETIKELRGVVKDLSYRNRQEKEYGDLEILEKKIQILKEAGFKEHEVKEIIGTFNSPITKIGKQVEKNQLKVIDQIKKPDNDKDKPDVP